MNSRLVVITAEVNYMETTVQLKRELLCLRKGKKFPTDAFALTTYATHLHSLSLSLSVFRHPSRMYIHLVNIKINLFPALFPIGTIYTLAE